MKHFKEAFIIEANGFFWSRALGWTSAFQEADQFRTEEKAKETAKYFSVLPWNEGRVFTVCKVLTTLEIVED